MKLRSKLLTILLASALLFGVTQGLIQHYVISPRFAALEKREAKKDLLRCVRTLETETEHLKALTHDWASWDDTCDFIKGGGPDYEEANLVLETFVDASLNAICFFDGNGDLFWGKAVDIETGAPLQIRLLSEGKLLQDHPLFVDASSFVYQKDISKSGIMRTEYGPMLVASLPILNTENKGPVMGTMVMARLITEAMKDRLRDQTQVPFDIKMIDPGYAEADSGDERKVFLKPLDENTLQASMIVKDITGKPRLELSADLPRDILQQGLASMRTARGVTAAAGILFLVLLIWLLEAAIVRPVVRLTGQMLVAGRTGELPGKVFAGRKDEIGTLENEFDSLLETVHSQSKELEEELTAKKNLAEKLEENFQKYKLLAENLKDVVATITPGGYIQYCSPAITEFSGHTVEEVEGRHVFGFMPENSDRERLIELVDNIAKSGESRSMEYVMRAKGGAGFPVESTAKPIMENGKLVLLHCVFRDISERKKVEDEKNRLEAKLQMAQRMEALGALTGGIAHNFNNVLAPIMGNTELAMLDIPEDSQAFKNLQQVLEASDKAKKMVRQILSFSDHGDEDPAMIDIEEVVEETYGLIRASLPSSIEIRKDVEKISGLVYADPKDLQQVLMNICANAAYAMKELGGVVDISLEEQDITEFDLDHSRKIKPGKYVKLSISDNGPGMESEVMQRIFEPYYTTKPVGEGSGMGLSEAFALISKYGGEIKAYSEPGMGASFYIYLPLMAASSKTLSKETLPQGSERILMVDDEEAVLTMTRQMVEHLGYKVTAVDNSPQALKIFEADPQAFDLIITDMTMPYVTGDSLANRILAIRPEMPIILCTGFSEKLSREQARSIGIKAYVTKPVVMAQIAGIIRSVLDQ
ncbi:PAS domain S-box-containing protein [Desulfatibacillum alkenivorans DSM 16219]|jgi:PAS domain S-box-containing protein|uniref:histidine kinase n=1 Tax=Desulfatibacillum alkenivorans DSM 16219 TaxID=1121393 RepID=A0A1M6J2A2_9BACT|nr:CHASE4 domain-containing protein [Desulfatibacillum alkenivorans]SHJ40721.1 PAS domain S-box-containing protein [Desulfatibacillum alkenivorans DSM 16219]